MSYAEYLIKVGNYEIPTDKFIKAYIYIPYVNMQALGPYTDADGYQHLNP